MQLVAISGVKGSGKGSVADFVAEWAQGHRLVVVERGFADYLKWAMARLFWPKIARDDAVEWANEFKNASDAQVRVLGADRGVLITGRELFQHGGTEMGRELFGEDFWVELLLPDPGWQSSFKRDGEFADIAVISDMRFANEAARVRQCGGQIWLVKRPGFRSDGHPSEAWLPAQIDQLVGNSGSLETLKRNVFEFCDMEFESLLMSELA